MGVVRQSTVGKLHKLSWKKFLSFVGTQKQPEKWKFKTEIITKLCDKMWTMKNCFAFGWMSDDIDKSLFLKFWAAMNCVKVSRSTSRCFCLLLNWIFRDEFFFISLVSVSSKFSWNQLELKATFHHFFSFSFFWYNEISGESALLSFGVFCTFCLFQRFFLFRWFFIRNEWTVPILDVCAFFYVSSSVIENCILHLKWNISRLSPFLMSIHSSPSPPPLNFAIRMISISDGTQNLLLWDFFWLESIESSLWFLVGKHTVINHQTHHHHSMNKLH